MNAICGSPKAAEHYAQATIDFAFDLGSTRLMVRALALRAEVRMNAGKLEAAGADLGMIERALPAVSVFAPTIRARIDV